MDLQDSGKLSIHLPSKSHQTGRYVPAYCWLRALRHAALVAASKILPSRHQRHQRHQSTETSTTVLLAVVLALFEN